MREPRTDISDAAHDHDDCVASADVRLAATAEPAGTVSGDDRAAGAYDVDETLVGATRQSAAQVDVVVTTQARLEQVRRVLLRLTNNGYRLRLRWNK